MLRRTIKSLLSQVKPFYLYSQPANNLTLRYNQKVTKKQYNEYFGRLEP